MALCIEAIKSHTTRKRDTSCHIICRKTDKKKGIFSSQVETKMKMAKLVTRGCFLGLPLCSYPVPSKGVNLFLVLVEGLFPWPVQLAELWWRPLQVPHLTTLLLVGFFLPSLGPLTLSFAIGPGFFTTKGGQPKANCR